jgi:hypothetical protein
MFRSGNVQARCKALSNLARRAQSLGLDLPQRRLGATDTLGELALGQVERLATAFEPVAKGFGHCHMLLLESRCTGQLPLFVPLFVPVNDLP